MPVEMVMSGIDSYRAISLTHSYVHWQENQRAIDDISVPDSDEVPVSGPGLIHVLRVLI